jgi:hypothetical protein
MGLSEGLTESRKNQERFKRRLCRKGRMRRCLLKGCDRRYHPVHPLQHYCSETCRRKAKKWRRWKDQQKYRATEPGKKKRQEQCQRRRERLKKAASDAAAKVARVSPIKFFRPLLRPPRMPRKIPKNPTFSPATFLFAPMPARVGAGFGKRTPLEKAMVESTGTSCAYSGGLLISEPSL